MKLRTRHALEKNGEGTRTAPEPQSDRKSKADEQGGSRGTHLDRQLITHLTPVFNAGSKRNRTTRERGHVRSVIYHPNEIGDVIRIIVEVEDGTALEGVLFEGRRE